MIFTNNRIDDDMRVVGNDKIFKFRKRRNKKTVGLFIIHGYLSTPEISYPGLKEILKRNKIKNYYFPFVQGHGYNVDPNTFDYKKALEDIENKYITFRAQHDYVYVIGFSMGGALAFYLAEACGVDKMVLLAPALKYGGDNRIIDKMSSFLRSSKEDDLAEDVIKKSIKNDKVTSDIISKIIDDGMRDGAANYKKEFDERYGKLKISVFFNFVRLISTIRRYTKDSQIGTPTRLYISENDDLVPIAGPMYAFERLATTDKKLTIYSGPQHRILQSSLREEIIEDMLKFLYNKKRIKIPKK